MNQNNRKTSWWMILIILLVVVLAVVFILQFVGNSKQSTYAQFKEDLDAGNIQAVYFNTGYSVNVVKRNTEAASRNNAEKYYDYFFYIGPNMHPVIYELITESNDSLPAGASAVQIGFNNPVQASFWDYLPTLFSIILIVVMFVFMINIFRSQNNQGMSFGKNTARVQQSVKTRFSDVAGAEEEKEELVEIIDFLKNPRKYTELGARIPAGVLLVGPPGTGKTLFAKAVAGEAGVPFFSISGSDFVEMFVGVGASRVRSLFEQAKKNMPCIVFIDEIDAVGIQRGAGLGGGNDEREQTLNQLLVEMDGFDTNSGIIVMAATNRPDVLDPALMRPGRFDRQIFVNRPDVRGREAILKVHARNKPIDATVDFKTIARITSGFTGADLENCLNEAAILAARDNRRQITMADVNEGITKMEMGPAKKSRLVTEHDKRITAYHEAGHAILACSLKNCEPVHEVTIIPRGMAAGFTMTRPENDNEHVSKAYLLDNITMTLGGRIAEELVIEDYCTGASGDIKALTERCRKMVTEWGMSEKVGLLYYGGDQEVFVGRDYHTTQGYSDETAALIDEEIRRIVDECHARGTEILKGKLDILHNMAKVLITKETIHTDEVNMLMEGKSAAEVIDFIDVKYSTQDKRPSASEGNDGVLPH